jgi:hypothetical protein
MGQRVGREAVKKRKIIFLPEIQLGLSRQNFLDGGSSHGKHLVSGDYV